MSFKTTIDISNFGTIATGEQIKVFTLKRKDGLMAKIINFGAVVTELHVPDSQGVYIDVVLGFLDVDTYLKENTYAGAIIGRIAGRVKNASFKINKETYKITKNEGSHHVHGGAVGFDKKIWKYEIIDSKDGQALKLTLFSPDGDEGFPGNVYVVVVYSLTKENGLKIDFTANTDQVTPICLTNHSYFNLSGERSIKNHNLQINANRVVVLDKEFIPTGKIATVIQDDNDFSKLVKLEDRLKFSKKPHGENYLLNGEFLKPEKVARLECAGRNMEVYSTASNLQVYTSSGLKTESSGKNGVSYGKYAGLCLECQGFSDALNHEGFKSILLYPEDTFTQSTEYRFGFCDN